MATQVTSIDPGNVPGGLFWTIPIPPKSVQIDLGQGTASFILDDVELKDFGTFCNDAMHGPSVPATASFNVQWSGVFQRYNVRNATEQYTGEFVVTGASLEYESSVPGRNFRFVSDEEETSINVFSQIGHERNGVFFK